MLSSCLSLSYNVVHKEYEGIEISFATDTVKVFADSLFAVSVEKTTTPKYEFYYIIIRYDGSRWLFLNGDIAIKADDKIIKISDSKPDKIVARGGGVVEIVRAAISKEDLKAIANSSVVKVGFFGAPVEIGETEIGYIKQFYTEFDSDK